MTTTAAYREQVPHEIDAVPEEYLSYVLRIGLNIISCFSRWVKHNAPLEPNIGVFDGTIVVRGEPLGCVAAGAQSPHAALGRDPGVVRPQPLNSVQAIMPRSARGRSVVRPCRGHYA